jgi:hypothetical protein
MSVECISTADLKQGRRYVERKQPDREQGWRAAFGMQSHRMLVARLIPCPSYDVLLCLLHQSYCHTLSHAAKSVHLLVYRRNTQAVSGGAVEARTIVGSRKWSWLGCISLLLVGVSNSFAHKSAPGLRQLPPNCACAVLHLQLHQPITVCSQAMHKVAIHPSNRL